MYRWAFSCNLFQSHITCLSYQISCQIWNTLSNLEVENLFLIVQEWLKLIKILITWLKGWLIRRCRAHLVVRFCCTVVTALSKIGVVKMKWWLPVPTTLKRHSVSLPATFFICIKIRLKAIDSCFWNFLVEHWKGFSKHSIALTQG